MPQFALAPAACWAEARGHVAAVLAAGGGAGEFYALAYMDPRAEATK